MNTKLNELIERCGGLAKLNSITKYPSIPTYHVLGEKGRLTEQRVKLGQGPWLVTEKVDGTNGRIILTEHGWLLGSREELLTAQGDIVSNPALGIVQAFRPDVEAKLWPWWSRSIRLPDIVVIYAEVYGGKTTAAARHYTDAPDVFGFRVFDIAVLSEKDIAGLQPLTPDQLSGWRESDRRRFMPRDARGFMDFEVGVELTERLQLVLVLDTVPDLPETIESANVWMKQIVGDGVNIVAHEHDQVEGVVVRSVNSEFLAKLRFEDYARTLKATVRR